MITLKWTPEDVVKMISNMTGRRATSATPCAQVFAVNSSEGIRNDKGLWFGDVSWTTDNLTADTELNFQLDKSVPSLTLMWTNIANLATFSIDIVQKDTIAFDQIQMTQGNSTTYIQFIGYVVEFD